MKPKAAITRPYPGRPDIIEGIHQKGVHLHFDINGDRDKIRAAFKPLVEKQKGFLEWDNFVLPTMAELRQAYGKSYRPAWDKHFEIMADPACFGAPQAHLSTKKFYGDVFSADFRKYLRLYEQGKKLVSRLPFTGYIEFEDVTEETIKDPATRHPAFDSNAKKFPGGPIPKIPLSRVRETEYNAQGRLVPAKGKHEPRYFRTSEIHVTFKEVARVHPGALASLLQAGFYSAYQIDAAGKLKFIATIQGFHREVSLVTERWFRWFYANSALISCGVKLKREDIMAYFIFGGNPKIQEVISYETD